MSRHRFFLMMTLLIITSNHLYAWGEIGHRVVARVALAQLTPDARRLVRELLGSPEGLIEEATWADRVRPERPQTYNWHFVDIPYDRTTYDPARDCRPSDRGDCAIAAIDRERRTLADVGRPRAERQEALKYLVHFVGDLHQPLHVIDNQDRGGNDQPVRLDGQIPDPLRPPNLHAAWDVLLIERHALQDEAFAVGLVARLSEIAWAAESIDPVRWATEGHAVAVLRIYTYPGFSATGPTKQMVVLDAAYQRVAEAVIDRQLLLAGGRLALILNDAAAKLAVPRKP